MKRTKKDIGEDIADYIFRSIIKNVSRKDFTLEQLKQMGYPYSKRGTGTLPSSIAPYMVHSRSGEFRKTFTMNRQGTNQYQDQFNIKFVPKQKYHKDIFKGTEKMVSRDPIGGTLSEHQVQKKIKQAIRNKMKMNFG